MLGVLYLLLLLGVFARAVDLQVTERSKLRELAEDQYFRQIEIPARRGEIVDRRGVVLAQSVDVDSLWVDPSLLPNPKQAARELAKRLHLDGGELMSRWSKAKRFAWLKRKVAPDEVSQVLSLKLPGVGAAKEPRRFYPQRELAAQVIGIAGSDGKGLEGVELAFDDELYGQASQVVGVRDAKGRKLLMQEAPAPALHRGATLTLSIDRQLQYASERAIARAVGEAQAAAGVAVLLDPVTGELLAVANHPSFNPNTPDLAAKDAIRNRAVVDTFEPGSTFKSFVVAAALEEGVVKPGDSFFCENGSWDVGRNTIHDTHPYGTLTPGRILQVSSNICAAKIGQLLGRDRFVSYMNRFGFGERFDLGVPGEGRGSLPFPKADIALVTQSFGQGLTVTAVQLAAAYGALANEGLLMRPYLVSRLVDSDGVVLLENRPTPVRQVVSRATARKVVSMLEGVVEKEGTAPKAKMDEYRVAGKTGTAQKADPVARGYSDKRIASFIGLLPAERPKLVILVVIDEPKVDIYGGLVAAPAFKEIAQYAMPYLGAPASVRPEGFAAVRAAVPPASVSRPQASRGAAPAETGYDQAVTEKLGEGTVRVPDVRGKVGREALLTLWQASLSPEVSGTGRVVEVSPPTGTPVRRGTRVALSLEPRD